MLRSRSNCRVIEVDPRVLVEVISLMPAMRPNRRSSGVATAEAIVSGLAPGRPALTLMVGKSTRGGGPTGNIRYAPMPANSNATDNRVVAIGRRMKGAETFMA